MRQQLGTMSSLTKEQGIEKYGINNDSLRLAYEKRDRDLNQLSSLYAENNKPTHWQEIQATLEKGEALVEIVRYEVEDLKSWQISDSVSYVALVVTNKTKEHPRLIDLTDGTYLERKGIKQYQNSIRHQQEDENSYNIFWKPIKDALKGVKKVYLSLDGVYHKVNLQALQNPAKGTFVMDELDVHLVTSGRDLIAKRPEKLKLKYGMLIGNPAFGDIPDDRTDEDNQRGFDQLFNNSERNGIADLPGAELEVKSVQKIFQDNGWREVTLLNEEAEEHELKDMLKPNILHIATHGFFQSDVSSIDRNKHPLYRSGLLLTGAAETISGGSDFRDSGGEAEDGVLTSFEAMNLNIDNTNLVVLSACETGLGEVINGEGVYGLQRAFSIAGARTIIMSLWKVDDNATQELMVLFYENWIERSMTKREALSTAQHTLKKKYPHPYYWGAFVLLGE